MKKKVKSRAIANRDMIIEALRCQVSGLTTANERSEKLHQHRMETIRKQFDEEVEVKMSIMKYSDENEIKLKDLESKLDQVETKCGALEERIIFYERIINKFTEEGK